MDGASRPSPSFICERARCFRSYLTRLRSDLLTERKRHTKHLLTYLLIIRSMAFLLSLARNPQRVTNLPHDTKKMFLTTPKWLRPGNFTNGTTTVDGRTVVPRVHATSCESEHPRRNAFFFFILSARSKSNNSKPPTRNALVVSFVRAWQKRNNERISGFFAASMAIFRRKSAWLHN